MRLTTSPFRTRRFTEVAREVIGDGGRRGKGSRQQKKGEGEEVKKSVQAGNSNFSRLKPTTTQSHTTDYYYKERRGGRGSVAVIIPEAKGGTKQQETLKS